jgi:hypothetical protein
LKDVHVCACMYACVCMHACMCAFVLCMLAHLYTHATSAYSSYMHKHYAYSLCLCMHACMCMHACLCMHACVCAYMHACIRSMHAYTLLIHLLHRTSSYSSYMHMPYAYSLCLCMHAFVQCMLAHLYIHATSSCSSYMHCALCLFICTNEPWISQAANAIENDSSIRGIDIDCRTYVPDQKNGKYDRSNAEIWKKYKLIFLKRKTFAYSIRKHLQTYIHVCICVCKHACIHESGCGCHLSICIDGCMHYIFHRLHVSMVDRSIQADKNKYSLLPPDRFSRVNSILLLLIASIHPLSSSSILNLPVATLLITSYVVLLFLINSLAVFDCN